jgi:hypothetical protein
LSFKIIFIQKSQIYVFRESLNNYAAHFYFWHEFLFLGPLSLPFFSAQTFPGESSFGFVLFSATAQQGSAFGPLASPSPLLLHSPLAAGDAARSG